MPPAPSRRVLLAFAAVLVAAGAVRLATWDEVFTRAGVRFLVDTDSHYHVLRAQRLLQGEPDAAWFDRRLDHPAGARILWPPGFDAGLAAATRLLHGASAARGELEGVAVFVPVVLGVLAVLVQLAFAARWLGARAAVVAGALAAVLPLEVQYGALGVVDQHVAEQLGFCVAVLGTAACASSRRWGPAAVALALGVGPWLWQGATLTAGLVAVAAAVVFVVRPEGDGAASDLLRRAAVGCGIAAGALAASMLAWGPPPQYRSAGLNGLSWIHPLATLAAALALGALAVLARLRPGGSVGRRAAAAGAVGLAAGGAVLAAMPGAVLHGLRSLRATDPWLSTITEFQPALGSIGSFGEDLQWLFWSVGPVLAAPALGLGAFRRAWARPEARTALTVLATGTAILVPLFLARARFVVYAAPFLVWWAGLFLADATARTGPAGSSAGRRALALAAAVAFLLPCVHLGTRPYRSVVDEDLVALLRWMRGEPGGPRGVLAPWTLGHAIQYYADAPVVVSPFGTDLGPDGMRRLAAFFYARTAPDAERVLRDGDLRWVLFEAGLGALSDAAPFAPEGAAPLVAERREYWGRGRAVVPLPAFGDSVFGVLYSADGARQPGGEASAIPFLRLVYETTAHRPYKVFERVEGARAVVSGVEPFQPVSVRVQVATRERRVFAWRAEARADGTGTATLRLPYATGRNGTSAASPYLVTAGSATAELAVEEGAVLGGGPVEVSLGPARVVRR